MGQSGESYDLVSVGLILKKDLYKTVHKYTPRNFMGYVSVEQFN